MDMFFVLPSPMILYTDAKAVGGKTASILVRIKMVTPICSSSHCILHLHELGWGGWGWGAGEDSFTYGTLMKQQKKY